MCAAVVGSACTCVFEAGSDREERSSDVCYVGDTRWSFSVKCDDSILHTHHLVRIVSHRNFFLKKKLTTTWERGHSRYNHRKEEGATHHQKGRWCYRSTTNKEQWETRTTQNVGEGQRAQHISREGAMNAET